MSRPETGSSPRLSVVLSFRNEAEVIPELLRRLERAVSALEGGYELIFVNDASDDGSLDLLAHAARTDTHLIVITMSRRFGPAECALAGLAHARGQAVVLMDADLQDPPELIPTLVDRWQQGADVVYTVRTARRGEPALKTWLTGAAYRAVRAVASVDVPVDAGDFRLMSRRVVDELLRLPERTPYLRGLVAWVGFRQVPVHYERQPRFAGRTHFPLLASANPWRTFLSGLTSFSSAPLVALLPLGLGVTAVTLLATTVVLLSPRWRAAMPLTALVGAGLAALVGLQLAALGLIGAYLGRIYDDVRGRPRYIIDSILGADHHPPGPRPPVA